MYTKPTTQVNIMLWMYTSMSYMHSGCVYSIQQYTGCILRNNKPKASHSIQRCHAWLCCWALICCNASFLFHGFTWNFNDYKKLPYLPIRSQLLTYHRRNVAWYQAFHCLDLCQNSKNYVLRGYVIVSINFFYLKKLTSSSSPLI